ncbi:MAG TPA: beta-ketoacyl synthase N-terminal-like domain-containing protein, partial [Nitrospiria bacterium]|nr:beta-ketoacyl synthase N-terminal-like domain-containing protein [Nitrospiria bacterium]
MQNLTQKFTMKPGFKIIVLTPPGLNDPTMAIAASRAGEWGVLNLEYGRNLPSALAAVSQLGRQARNECGIKISSTADESFVQEVTNNLPELIRIVVLTCSKASLERLPDVLETFHRARKTVVLEVTTAEQADLGVRIGVDGLIAKGHEAGGRVGEETAFILLQRILKHTALPVWVQGGIGLHTAAACYAAGAAGVVLDAQMALTRESGLPDSTKALIERMDGSESICLGAEIGLTFRIYNRAGLPVVDELRKTAQSLIEFADTKKKIEGLWHAAIESRIGWESAERQIMPLGQDAAFAATLAKTYGTVGGILQAIRDSVNAHVRTARKLRPLDEGAPLAQAHKTRYPIVQGPMTRVSDTAEFAARVAEGGALPFLALALLRAKEVEALLEETRRSLGDRSWGVGILGFVPLDLRQEQLEAIRKVRPPFALIAGGRPDQALVLEEQGIPTYLHVPSPGLLKMFLENGARRFVFEGRECGGHVGPRTSFVLWNLMIDVLLESSSPKDLADCHILFAGGIHDALSASMVATMAAPLAERGVRIGALLGTAYLFTEEAVAAKAIVPGFQKEAARCDHTVLLESGPGHAIRCVDNPYADFFNREKKRLFKEGRSPEQVREALEELNLGRLRIASKGFVRNDRYGKDPDAPKLSLLGEEEQRAQGMYMIGQVAAFRDGIGSIGELHYDVAVRGSERLRDLAESGESSIVRRSFDRPSDIAIVGMGCLLPGAQELRTFWENIVNKVNGITEVPKDRWDWRLYYHSDQKARDKVSSRWGGFLGDIPFDPMRYGMPPSSLDSIEPLQLLTLEVVRQALTDAGYGVPSVGLAGRPFHRERASVILGVGGGIADLGQQYAIRSALPMLFENPSPDIWNRLPEWTEDSFAGILPNVAAGRVANRFDLGGVNYTVDAACASSLAALYMAVRELESGSSDMVIVGGADTIQNPFAFLCFSKTHALSPRGRCRTFDETADGIAISEGLAVLVVKRLEDAERDGDRIYAVIKSVAGSSDGRDKGLTAPRPEGQIRALERAYAKAGFSPATVELIEAHGTGTVAGDQAEAESLIRLLSSAGTPQQNCAIGSVKSMIGHTKSTAGIVGILKAALSLHFGVLPPTIGVEKPNSKVGFRQSPIYINAESRPWIGHPEHPRRAGVSSFGFGGTNFHAVLEEYDGASANSAAPAALRNWPAELFVWGGESTRALLAALEPVERALARREKPALPDLADAVYRGARKMKAGSDRYRLAVVATSREDLEQKLKAARTILSRSTPEPVSDPRGIYFSEARREGKIAFLFSGQGSQYPDMLKDLAIHFPEARKRFEQADRVLSDRYPRRLSSYVFPPPRFFPEEEKASQQALTQTNVAQPAIGAADMALFALMKEFGIAPDMTAGHSYGEYAALCAAGAFDEETLYRISEARGRIILEAAAGRDLGTMAAVEADREAVSEALKTMEGIFMANLNSPKQTIVSGTRPAVERAIEDFKAKGVGARPIPVACAFHSPLVAPAKEPFRAFLETLDFKPPRIEVFSNSLAAPHTKDPSAIVANLAEHLTRPVEFVREIEAMYAAGARTFVEIGPRNVLTALCQQILGDRPHRALATDSPGRSGLTQLEHVLAQLFIAGLAVNLDPLFRGRAVARLDLDAPEMKAVPEVLSPTTWLVNGGRARPMQNATHRAKGVARDSMADKLNTRQVEITKDDGKKEDKPQTVRAADMNPPEIQSPSRAPIETSAHQNIKPAEDKEWAMDPRVGPDGDASQVMIHYQRLMARFLDTQKNVMLAYLRSAPPPSPGQTKGAAAAPSQAVTVNPAPRRVQPMVAPPIAQPVVQDTQASPGSAPALASPPPSPSDIVTAPAKPAELGREDLTERLVQIVSDRTGYPREMLDLDSNIEADLGIDSIKRVEILGAFQRSLPAERRLPPGTMEKLTAIKTMRGIIDWALNAFVDARSVSVPPSSASEKTAGSVHPAGLGREDLTDRLVQIVSDRTGYPREMLDLDSNIEADLGIDSIKRVEILGAFQRSLPAERRLPP